MHEEKNETQVYYSSPSLMLFVLIVFGQPCLVGNIYLHKYADLKREFALVINLHLL